MIAALEGFGDALCGQHGSHGQAASQGLGQGHDVRLHSRMLLAEPFSGAAKAGLHLVENEQCSGIVTDLAGSAQVVGIRHVNPRLSLHRLKDYRSRLFCYCRLHGLNIVVWYEVGLI